MTGAPPAATGDPPPAAAAGAGVAATVGADGAAGAEVSTCCCCDTLYSYLYVPVTVAPSKNASDSARLAEPSDFSPFKIAALSAADEDMFLLRSGNRADAAVAAAAAPPVATCLSFSTAYVRLSEARTRRIRAFHILMVGLATILGLWGLNNLLHGFEAMSATKTARKQG